MEKELFQISHEIKNSLSVMKGYMALFDGSLEKYEKYMPYLYKSIDHSICLLKDFASIGKLDIKKDILDINYLIEEVLDLYKPILSLKGINLTFDSKNYIYTDGDYNRLKQVFINVLENAIDAVKDTLKPNIIIKTKVKDMKIEITFKDNGCGMDNYTISHIFNPFYTTKKYGTGLGMYISHKIILLHNGEILCIPNKKGTTIKIKLDQYKI